MPFGHYRACPRFGGPPSPALLTDRTGTTPEPALVKPASTEPSTQGFYGAACRRDVASRDFAGGKTVRAEQSEGAPVLGRRLSGREARK